MKIVATTSLPAVDRPNADRWNAARSHQLLNKLWPKYAESLPRAKINHIGKFISAPAGIKKLLAKEYKERLRARTMRSEMSYLKKKKKRILKMKLKLASNNKSKPWTMAVLELALRHAKSREPGNLVPGHFWSKIRTFFRNQWFKELNLKLCCVFVKCRFK